MQASDIMTTTMITVGPDIAVFEVARTLLARNIGAVPVVDAKGAVMGIVSETDLLRRPETGTLRPPSWLSFFEDSPSLAEQYTRVHGIQARDVMNKHVQSVKPDTKLVDIVDLMEKRRIRRVLVMQGGKLMGIVCRSDLLRGMLASRDKAAASEGDRAIRAMLLEELRDQPWRTIAGNNIIVTNGTVSFWGSAGSDEERRALRVAAENTPGVTWVEDHMTPHPEIPVPLL